MLGTTSEEENIIMSKNLLCVFLAALFFFNVDTPAFAKNSSLSDLEKEFVFNGRTKAEYLSMRQMQQLEGRAAPLIAVVVIQGGRMIVQRWVSTSVAKNMAARGAANLWAPTSQSARAIAKAGSRGGKPIREFHSGAGKRFTHYHTNPRNGGHVWYGTARQYGFAAGTAWGAFSCSGLRL